MKLRVVHLVDDLNTGGIEELSKTKYDVRV